MSESHEVYVNKRFQYYLTEHEGNSVVEILEQQYNCSISVLKDVLTIKSTIGCQIDTNQIENILREMWKKREDRLIVRMAALNASCTHVCQTFLPRSYSAVAILYAHDIRRRSKCDDIINDHIDGRIAMYGEEIAVNRARTLLIELLMEDFGPLDIEIPAPTRTSFEHILSSDFTYQTFGDSSSSLVPPMLNVNNNNGYVDGLSRQVNNEINNAGFRLPPVSPFYSAFQDNPINSIQGYRTPPEVGMEVIGLRLNKEDANKVMRNAGAIKKQVESQMNCAIQRRPEPSKLSLTLFEIFSATQEQCRAARDYLCHILNSTKDVPEKPNTSSPEATPTEKRFPKRTGFRNQPKILLALSPRKSNLVE